MSDSLWSHGLQHAGLLSPLSPKVCSDSYPLSQRWCLTVSSSAALLSFCVQSFPASGSFPMSWLFVSDSQNIGASASASILPMNIQDWFPLGFKINHKVKLLSSFWLLAIPWTVACQAPPSMGFSRQEYWSGLPFPSPGDLPNPGIEPGLLLCRQMLYPLSHSQLYYGLNKFLHTDLLFPFSYPNLGICHM